MVGVFCYFIRGKGRNALSRGLWNKAETFNKLLAPPIIADFQRIVKKKQALGAFPPLGENGKRGKTTKPKPKARKGAAAPTRRKATEGADRQSPTERKSRRTAQRAGRPPERRLGEPAPPGQSPNERGGAKARAPTGAAKAGWPLAGGRSPEPGEGGLAAEGAPKGRREGGAGQKHGTNLTNSATMPD